MTFNLSSDIPLHCFSSDGMNVPLIAAMAAMTALTMFGVAFMALKRKPRDARYMLLDN